MKEKIIKLYVYHVIVARKHLSFRESERVPTDSLRIRKIDILGNNDLLDHFTLFERFLNFIF